MKNIMLMIVIGVIGFVGGWLFGYNQCIDYGVEIMSKVLDINLKPEIMKEILIRYGERI